MNIMEYDLENLDFETLYGIRSSVDKEICRRSRAKAEEDRELKKVYLGKCYENDNCLIKIVDFDFTNKYSMECLCFDWSAGADDFFVNFDNIGLFCNDYKNPGHQIIERYKEISEEEFRLKFNTKINEFCFGKHRCQD